MSKTTKKQDENEERKDLIEYQMKFSHPLNHTELIYLQHGLARELNCGVSAFVGSGESYLIVHGEPLLDKINEYRNYKIIKSFDLYTGK